MLREFGVEPLERFEVLTLIGMEERFAEERIFVVRTGDYRERCHRADDKPMNENAAHGLPVLEFDRRTANGTTGEFDSD